MLGLELIHVSKRGHWSIAFDSFDLDGKAKHVELQVEIENKMAPETVIVIQNLVKKRPHIKDETGHWWNRKRKINGKLAEKSRRGWEIIFITIYVYRRAVYTGTILNRKS